MPLFTPSLRNAHHDTKSTYGEGRAKNEANNHNLHKPVSIGKHKYEDIKEPYIVEYTVEQYIIKVGYHIGEREVSVAPKDILVLSDTKTNKGFRPSFPLLEKSRPFFRHAGHAYGIFSEPYFMTRLAKLLSDVAVETRTYIPCTDLTKHFSIEFTECT